jgi:hypothetical protein
MRCALPVLTALSLAAAPAPALAKPAVVPLERVDPMLFGLLGYSPASNGFLGLWPSHTKLFRLSGNNKSVFRGLGQENDVADFFFPTLTVRPVLRRVIDPVPEARRQLTQFEKGVATANALSIGGSALWWGGLLAVPVAVVLAANNNPGGATIVGFGALGGLVGGRIMTETLAPAVTSRSYFHLNEAVAAYNAAYGYQD